MTCQSCKLVFACPHLLKIHHWKYWFTIKQWRPMVFHQPLVVWHSRFVPAVGCHMSCLYRPQLAGLQGLLVDAIGLWCRYIHQGLQLSKNEADRMRYVARHRAPHSLCNVDCPNMARLACSSEHNLQHALQSNRHLTYLQNNFSRSLDFFTRPRSWLNMCRNRDLDRVLQQKKLILVLDLDHTLLNSTGINEVSHLCKGA